MKLGDWNGGRERADVERLTEVIQRMTWFGVLSGTVSHRIPGAGISR